MRFLCRIGWHKWGFWEDRVAKNDWGTESIVGQIKTCDLCNRSKIKLWER